MFELANHFEFLWSIQNILCLVKGMLLLLLHFALCFSDEFFIFFLLIGKIWYSNGGDQHAYIRFYKLKRLQKKKIELFTHYKNKKFTHYLFIILNTRIKKLYCSGDSWIVLLFQSIGCLEHGSLWKSGQVPLVYYNALFSNFAELSLVLCFFFLTIHK